LAHADRDHSDHGAGRDGYGKSNIKNLLNKEERAALGEVAVEAAQLDITLEITLRFVLQFSYREYKGVVGGRTLGRKLDVLKIIGWSRLGGKQKKRHRKRLKDLISELKSLVDERNTAIHGIWGPEGGFSEADLKAITDGSFRPRPAEAVGESGGKTVKAARLEDLGVELRDATKRLEEFANRTWRRRGVQLRVEEI
jgi:hypothetical protein